jgi:DNA-directed RNA polymerase sigma subunit (sigma70/sigma32)
MVGFNDNFIAKCLEKGISERNLMIVLDRARGVTLAEIARDEGVSPERIRQIEAKVLRKMKNLKGN